MGWNKKTAAPWDSIFVSPFKCERKVIKKFAMQISQRKDLMHSLCPEPTNSYINLMYMRFLAFSPSIWLPQILGHRSSYSTKWSTCKYWTLRRFYEHDSRFITLFSKPIMLRGSQALEGYIITCMMLGFGPLSIWIPWMSILVVLMRSRSPNK